MKKTIVHIAGIPIELSYHYSDSMPYLERFRTDETPIVKAEVPTAYIERRRPMYEPGTPAFYIEATESATFASQALLPYQRAIFHAVAFTWQDRGYLMTAPSGTGKTTQYALWKKLYGDEVQMINGDKPALSFAESEIRIYPTPWTGKENMGQMRTAPLCGIVVLEQAQTDEIRLLSPKEAIARIFCQFMIPAEEPKEAKIVAAMTDRMLRETPVWLFRNRGTMEGTALCHDALLEYEKEHTK